MKPRNHIAAPIARLASGDMVIYGNRNDKSSCVSREPRSWGPPASKRQYHNAKTTMLDVGAPEGRSRPHQRDRRLSVGWYGSDEHDDGGDESDREQRVDRARPSAAHNASRDKDLQTDRWSVSVASRSRASYPTPSPT